MKKIKPPALRMSNGQEFYIFTPEIVQAYLEIAGKVVFMLPASGSRPAGYKSNWPEYVRSQMEAYGYNAAESPKLRPTAKQMDVFYNVLEWLPLIEDIRYRKVVSARMVTHPQSNKPLFSFRRIAKKMSIDHKTAARWYDLGLDDLTNELNKDFIPK